MRKLLNWKSILFMNTALFPDTFISVVEVLFFSVYLKLSFADFSFIFSFCLFISIFLQVPTGYISDKFGRKLMLLFGSLMDILGIVVIILLPHIMIGQLFLPVLIIESARTAMRALANGNSDVLIFNMFKKTGLEENEFMKKSSTFFSIGAIIAALSGLVSTILFSYWTVLPLIVDMIVKILQLIINFFIVEDSHERKKTNGEKVKLLKLKIDKSLLGLLFVLALLFTISRGTFSLYQPIMTSLGIPLVYYGAMIMIINFSIFFLVKAVKKYLKKRNIYGLIPIVVLVLVFQIFILLSTVINSVLWRFVIISIVFSVMQVTRLLSEGLSSYFINIKINNKKDKTTIFSSYSMISHIMLSALFLVMGLLQKTSLSYINIYCIVSVGIGMVFLIIRIKNRSQ